MVVCQNCEKNILKPDKKIENSSFYVAVYTCDKCCASFKVDYPMVFEASLGRR